MIASPLGATMLALLTIGLVGQSHCATMCGGIAAAPFATMPPARGGWPAALAYQLGRVSTYAALGALAGAAGQVSVRAPFPMGGLALLLRLVAGVMLALVALQLFGVGRGASWVEALARGPFARLAGPARRTLAGRRDMRSAFALGAVWGLLPCGLVYSALPVAALAGSLEGGALAMGAFGVGTVPVMLGASLLAERFAAARRRPVYRRAAGVALLLSALLQLSFVTRSLAASDPPDDACCARSGQH